MSKFDQLPEELISVIFSYLNKPMKLQCRFLNWKCYSLISRSSFKTLAIHNQQDLEKTITLIKQASQLGALVETLKIICCSLDQETLLMLSQLFPNIKKFKGGERLILDNHAHSIHLNYGEWNFLKKFSGLTILDVSLQYMWPWSEKDLEDYKPLYRCTKHFIESLKNCQVLEKLSFSRCALDLIDMENLHNFTPTLKDLKMDKIVIYKNTLIEGDRMTNSSGEDNAIERIKFNSLDLSFYTFFYMEYDHHTKFANWFDYIGSKYKGLSKLHISLHSQNDYYFGELEQYIPKIFRHSPDMKRFKNNLVPITFSLMETMDKLLISLEEIGFCAEDSLELGPTIEPQLMLVQSSQQATTLYSLCILDYSNRRQHYGFLEIKLPHLVNLDVDYYGIELDDITMIMKNLPNLECLLVKKINFADYQLSQISEELRTKIRKISLSSNGEPLSSDVTTFSGYLNFIVKSCPLLERCSLFIDAPFYGGGDDELELHFSEEQISLKYLEVRSFSPEYTFKRVRGREKLRLTNREGDSENVRNVDLYWPNSVDHSIVVKLHDTDNCYTQW